MKHTRRPKFSLLTTFSLVAFVLTAAIAIALAWGLQQHLEQDALRQEAENAAEQVMTVLNPNLRLADLTGPLAPARYAEIDTLIRQNLLRQHIVRVKIWSRDGLLLYSDEKDLVGRRFPMTRELKEALAGKSAMEISSLEAEENIGERGRFSRLIEVYVPLQPADSPQVAGAYEIYHDMAVLEPHIAGASRFVWGSVGLGFLVLYGSLFALVRNASRELIRRNEENVRLFEAEQTRRAELAALYDLARALANTLDFDTILNLVVRATAETVQVTFARFALIEDGECVVRAAYPLRVVNRDLEVGRRDPVAAYPYCQRVLKQNAPIVLRANSPDLSEQEREALFLEIAQSLCLVPLRVSERPLGLLMLGEMRREEREPFSDDKIRLARSIGDQAASALHRAELFDELERAYLQTVLALAQAMDAKDTYTADHAQRLAAMALAVAREMGMSPRELEDLRYGAILHDVGKIGVPDAILQKPAKLDADEWARMRQHPAIGAQILAPLPRLAGAARVVRHHHERYDGSGYPDGLAGEAIPVGARILTVVDSYSAIRDARVYKAARSREEAIAELRKHAGTQFDPHIVETFLRLLARGIDMTEGRSFGAESGCGG